MNEIKSTRVEKLLLFITGASIPLINLRIHMQLYSISIYMVSILLLLVYLLLIDNSFRKKLLAINVAKQEIIIFTFMICLLFSVFYSTNQLLGIQKIIKLWISIMFYIILTRILITKSYYTTKIMSYATKVYPLYIIYLGYYYLIKFKVSYLGINTEYATGAGKNSLSFMASIVIAFSITALLDKRLRLQQKIVYTFLNIVTIVSVFLIQSRGFFLVFIMHILVCFLLTSKKTSQAIKILCICGTVLIVIMLSMPDYMVESVINRFSGIGAVFSGNASVGTLSEGRTHLIERSIGLFSESPLIGVGMGSFMYYGGIETLISHNDYLLVFAEQGIIGLVIFILLIFSFVKLAYINYKKEKSLVNKSLLMAMLGIVLYFLFINAYDNILVWTVFAMISSSNRKLKLNYKNI